MSYQDIIDNKICEICGEYAEKGHHRHHIRHRVGNHKEIDLDIKENLICLCWKCHTKVHNGNIKRWQLIEIAARREGITPRDICEAIGLLVDKVMPNDYIFKDESNPLFGRSLEDVAQEYACYDEVESAAIWAKAEILYYIVENMKKNGGKLNEIYKKISPCVGCAPETIKVRVRTFQAFPEPHMRAQDKSFTIHRIAAATEEPEKWLDAACANDYSTRQLSEAITAEKGSKNGVIKDATEAKAARAVRMVKEVLEYGNEPAAWLREQLGQLLEETKHDHITRIA
jgi:hypothetical protein